MPINVFWALCFIHFFSSLELECLILEKRRLQGDLRTAFCYLKGRTRKLERDFLQGQVVTGQGVMALN